VSSNKRRGGRKPAAASRRRTRKFAFLSAVVLAVASVGAFIAFQAFTVHDTRVPERAVAGEGRVLGDPDAPVTIIEYADYQCPVCKRAETSLLPRLIADYVDTGVAKIEFRNFPIIGQESWNAAQAAEAADDQGKFWQYHDALYNAQGRENGGAFTYEKLVKIAQDLGLDVPRFEQALGDNVHLADIQAESDAAHAAGVSATPTFFIGSKKIVGLQDYGTFADAVMQAQEQAR
jgi:protein-disulfide isomerase